MNYTSTKYAPIPKWVAISGCSRTRTYDELGRGNLKAVKLGNRTLIDIEAGLAWMQLLPAAQVRAPKTAA